MTESTTRRGAAPRVSRSPRGTSRTPQRGEIIPIAGGATGAEGGAATVEPGSAEGERIRGPGTARAGERQPNAAAFFPWLAYLADGQPPQAPFTPAAAFFPWWPVVEQSDCKGAPRDAYPPSPQEDELDGPSSIDRLLHAAVGRATLGLSPAALALAYADWAVHLASSPGKQAHLVEKALRKAVRLGLYALRCATEPDTCPCIEPLLQDRRFRGQPWQQWPFNLSTRAFS